MELFIEDADKEKAILICDELKNNKDKKKWDSNYYGTIGLKNNNILIFEVESGRRSMKACCYLTQGRIQKLFSDDNIIYAYYSKHFFPIRIPQMDFSNEELNTLFPDKTSTAETVREKINSIISNKETKKKITIIDNLHTGHYGLIEKINNFYNKG